MYTWIPILTRKFLCFTFTQFFARILIQYLHIMQRFVFNELQLKKIVDVSFKYLFLDETFSIHCHGDELRKSYGTDLEEMFAI